tara:strand:- start:12715 stop:14220 length:1506 start_codon:yes stop_codon:yes gene_type:complete
MKKIALLPAYLIFGLLLFTSCSTDDSPPPDDSAITINKTSLMANLLTRMSEPPTEPTAITCVSINYPINLNIFNAAGQQTGTQTISSDLELLLFISNLEPGSGFSIVFPISITLESGNVVEINNLQELEDIILACDASGGQIPANFADILTDGVWYVNYFFDDEDETFLFNGYQFSFNADQTALADNGSNQVNGTWELTTSSTLDFVLFFGTNSPFDELDDDWDIIEVTPEIIRLKDVSGGDGSVEFLTFGRTPTTGGGGTNSFVENLTTGDWYVTLLNDDGDIETCHYINYTFSFAADQSVTATSSGNTVNGSWQVQNSSSGLDLVLDFQISGDDDPFDDLNDDWDVVDFNTNLISLLDISGGDGSTDILKFGRTPAADCTGGANPQDLIDIMISGSWFVANYLDDGINQTAPYTGYTVDFISDGTVTAANGSQTLNGSWAVTLSGDGSGLDVVLDFGSQVPFDEFNDDWDVEGFTDTSIDLKDVSGGDGSVDTLRFEKL